MMLQLHPVRLLCSMMFQAIRERLRLGSRPTVEQVAKPTAPSDTAHREHIAAE
jgi:hypothetical protein